MSCVSNKCRMEQRETNLVMPDRGRASVIQKKKSEVSGYASRTWKRTSMRACAAKDTLYAMYAYAREKTRETP